MYQGTGEPKNFKVQSQVHKGLINQCSSSITSTGVMTQMSIKCHLKLITVEIKFKCDDLVNQMSITNSDHYQLLVQLYSIKAQSTLK